MHGYEEHGTLYQNEESITRGSEVKAPGCGPN